MSQNQIHYFGIRHHGPGSTKRLVAALNKLQPVKILIEGPADCSELLPFLAHKNMQPPVALLAFVADEAAVSFYYPFADFSPEYQACLWAVKNNIEPVFIDIPAAIQLAQILDMQAKNEAHTTENKELDERALLITQTETDKDTDEQLPSRSLEPIARDPIGVLAKLAGYEDGEAWWNDLIEQNNDDDEAIFHTVELAMSALRSSLNKDDPSLTRDRLREAYMRLEIAKHAKDINGPIAVVCGAWHVPAFKEKHAAKADRDLLKSLPTKLAKSKFKTTWVPWTSPRLAVRSGYGAGVDAPMWYQHLWQQRDNNNALEHWFCQISQALRDNGHMVSTASVIEAVRLSDSLATVRNRPSPGFEEIREAVIACMCFGESLVWRQLENKILLGHQVGDIPDNSPTVPLLDDLKIQQKKNKLKPEALQRELSVDLRSASGLGKSTLLHRLNILGVPWGKLTDSGSSRGTFRERWQLCWEPEFAVRLVENLIYGTTIEQSADNKISDSLSHENNLSKLADIVQLCLESQLNKAAERGLKRLAERAAHASDCIELLESLPPLVKLSRYGTAREISLWHIQELVVRLITQSALTLPYACRNLDDEEARHYQHRLNAAHQAIELAEPEPSLLEFWWQSLHHVIESSQSSLHVSGLCARLLYQSERLPSDALQNMLQKMLSPALPASDAARFFDGFFSDAVERLLYDELLLRAVENWLVSLDANEFIEFLPLFRRIFSGLDAMERRRMIDSILAGPSHRGLKKSADSETLALWPAHFQRISSLLQRNKDWTL